jgi:hypothetical protein
VNDTAQRHDECGRVNMFRRMTWSRPSATFCCEDSRKRACDNMMTCGQQFSIAQAHITPQNAVVEIDRCLRSCIVERRPVYLQIPSDVPYLCIRTPVVAELASSSRRSPCATPCTRAFPDESTERFIEVCLIRQTAFNRYLRERRAGPQHHALRTLDSPLHHIRVRWFAETCPECAAEMEDAQFNQTCQIRRTDGRIEVRFDMSRHLANLPRRKTSARG